LISKSCRRTAFPKASDCADYRSHRHYSRDLRSAKWCFGVILRGSNPKPFMAALGQKRTWPHFRSMSALPPKADIRIGSDYVRRSSSGSLTIFAAMRRALSD
jgi:hypothetical protein